MNDNEMGQTVIRNSLWRTAGYATGASLHFLIIVLIGRYLGIEGFGHFAFISAFVGVFQLMADMGVRDMLIRNIAVDKAHFQDHLGIARILLWSLSLVSLGCVAGLVQLLHLTQEIRQATYLAGVATVFTFYGLGYGAVLRAFEEMQWDILGFVLHKVVFIGLIWGVSQTTWGLRGVFMAMLLANGGLWFYAWAVVRLRHGRARIRLDLHAAWALFVEAFPLGIAELFGRLKQHVDKFVLLTLGTPASLGLFSAAYKFFEAMTPFTLNVTLPLFPVFSRLVQSAPERLFTVFTQSLKYLYVVGVPPAVLSFVFAPQLIVFFFGQAYHEAAVTLRLLSPAMLLLLPTATYSYIFTALGYQRRYTACAALSLLVNIGLDLLLIPLYSHVGAAIGTLLAEASLFLCGILMLRQLGGRIVNVASIVRPFLAGLVLGALCWWVKDMGLPALLLGILGGLMVYGVMLFVLQILNRQDLAFLRHMLNVKFRRALA